MNIRFVDLKAQYTSIKGEIDKAIQDILDNTSFIGGDKVRLFEEAYARYLGINHCVTCANGTDAIEIGLKALGVGPGDEVIVPAMSWIATSEAVSTVGATPVFVDILPFNYTINPSLIEEKISAKTKAIIPVHFYGRMAKMDEIMSIAQKHDLFVLEDAAQAHGAMFNGQMVGGFGDLATFSFFPGKNLGAYGDAGAIVTNNDDLAEKCRLIGNHGQQGKHNHLLEGRNSRMDTLQAAVLSVKLQYLEKWTTMRVELAAYYDELLSSMGFSIAEQVSKNDRHVYHVYAVELDKRDAVKQALLAKGIETQIHYPNALVSMKPYAHRTDPHDFPVAVQLAEKGLSLPMFAEMTKTQVKYVVDNLTDLSLL